MNAPERLLLPDVQSQVDRRNLPIDGVGVRGVRYPLQVASGTSIVSTIATLAMTVALPAAVKGTHMSRFIEILEAQRAPLDRRGFVALAQRMLERLQAASGMVEMQFPYFLRKTAPVSRVSSLLDADVLWRVRVDADGGYEFDMRIVAAATSLCPCSKEISAYGAHNQRSHISIEARIDGEMEIEELVSIAERNASCEVYGLLKRPDEKYVTEHAYENAKFVEDLVRDVALALEQDARVRAYIVEAENFESIHNHSAIARIVGPRAHPPQDA